MSILGKIYKGAPVEDLDVADIISVGPRPTEVEATTEDDPQFDEDIRRSIQKREGWFYDRDGPQPPVTEAESEEITRQVEAAREELQQIEAYVQAVQDKIEKQITDAAAAGEEVSIKLNTTNKPSLKKAIRKLFGGNKTQISLSDYKALLQARTKLEQEAVVDYSKGFPR